MDTFKKPLPQSNNANCHHPEVYLCMKKFMHEETAPSFCKVGSHSDPTQHNNKTGKGQGISFIAWK